MINDKLYIGQLLKSERIKKHLSLENVGDAIGVGKSAVYKYETDGISDLEKIDAICSFLNINIHCIIDDSYHESSVASEQYICQYNRNKYDIIERNTDFSIAKPRLLQDIDTTKSVFVFCSDDKLLRECGDTIREKGYEIRLLNLQDLEHSDYYNPLYFLYTDLDVLDFCGELIKMGGYTSPSQSDPFWENAESVLLSALILFLKECTTSEQQNFCSIMKLLRAARIYGNSIDRKSDLDRLFENLEFKNYRSIALKQYSAFKTAAENSVRSVLMTTLIHLSLFNMKEVEQLTSNNNINFTPIDKTVTFIIYPLQKSLRLLFDLFRWQLNRALNDEYKAESLTNSEGEYDYISDYEEKRKIEQYKETSRSVMEKLLTDKPVDLDEMLDRMNRIELIRDDDYD